MEIRWYDATHEPAATVYGDALSLLTKELGLQARPGVKGRQNRPLRVGEAKQKTKRAARSDWTQRYARAGLVAKGVTFVIVAALALGVALGLGGKIEDRPGALQALAENTWGRFLLAALAVGLGGYALWRFAQAYLGEKLESGEADGWLKRVGLVARGLVYTWLFVMSLSLVLNADEPLSGGGRSGGGQEEDRATGIVLEQPLGRWLVAAVGLGIIGAGLFNLYRALTQRFRKDLKEQQMDRKERRSYTVLGVVGHLARAVLFAMAGWFLVKAAWEYDPNEATGLDGALRKLARAEYGELLLGLTAAGLLAYGLFCFVQARYREV